MLPIDKINNLIKQQIISVLSTFTQTRIGTIAGYDPNTYTSKVLIQPEGILTNYLPIISFNVGIGWGFYTAPRDGDMCIVHFQEGSLNSGFIGGFIYNSVDIPISPAPPAGETWMIHKTGTFLKFHNDGTIEIKTLDTNNNPTNVNITSNVVITGNVTVNGNILAQGTGKGNITATGDMLDTSQTNTNTVKDMRNIYDSHVHPGVAVGGGDTLVTTQTM